MFYAHIAIYTACFTIGMLHGTIYPVSSLWYSAFGLVLGIKLWQMAKRHHDKRLQGIVDECEAKNRETLTEVEGMFANRGDQS